MKNFNGKILFLDRSDINTDEIIPAKYLTELTKAALKPYCLEDLSLPGFDPKKDIAGKSVIVTRANFGCGSSREHAVIALINMGAAAVLADSFARIFFRNAVNLGLLPIICRGISRRVRDGQTVKLDLENWTAAVEETGEVLPCEPLGDQALKILEAGGIKPLMRARFGKKDED